MPRRNDLQKILMIGSGPIIIGQACEFDYSGTQALKALKREGFEVILVNSNPATIMTDPEFADRTYIEPITPEVIAQIIDRERPDALLPTLGGQTSLNAAFDLNKMGILDKYNVELIGAKVDAIEKAEDRKLFQETMRQAGLEIPQGGTICSMDEAMTLVKDLPFPVIIRPSFTLGGIGGSIAHTLDEYREFIKNGLDASPIHEVLVEESIIGWKEYELEVMRDNMDNVVIICSIENLDMMGVHTGDSITIAPAQTLTDREYQRMRDWAIRVIRAIGVETGGSNIQFAVHPDTGRMVVIEMNPRVSRSSALASKATGYPIAKIAALLSVGYTLDEITNDITGTTPASFEPTIDYVVVKIPRWDFEKFPKADQQLNTSMKSIGEVMAIGKTFKEALQKGFRSLEMGIHGLGAEQKEPLSWSELDNRSHNERLAAIRYRLEVPTPDRLFYIRYAFQKGMSLQEITDISSIDPWFLEQIRQIVSLESELVQAAADGLSAASNGLLLRAKQYGFSDFQLAYLFNTSEEAVRNHRHGQNLHAVFKMVDTCAAEFESRTPYFYSTFERENEVTVHEKKRIMILGGGPNRIGQGIEFDYCCVHAVFALRELGYETIMVNSNPETVSTDYDTADKLYFEPLTLENILSICHYEKPDGVIVQFGGQTPLRLCLPLHNSGIPIIGTSPASIDLAENREKFADLLEKLQIPYPEYGTAVDTEGALAVARRLQYPVLIRPSYVLGGRAMAIVYNDDDLIGYMQSAVHASPDHPVLIDRFLDDAYEFDVDAIADGTQCIVGGFMQHIEGAGIHSGDSACVLPPYMEMSDQIELMRTYTHQLAAALQVRGILNIQYAVQNGKVYILEVNPRASRTIPFVSKATGVPLAKIAAKIMVGKTLEELGLTEEIEVQHVSIKESVFPFDKFSDVDSFLSPEMRSTGEVMGIWKDLGTAFAKSQTCAGVELPLQGGVLITVNDHDKPRALNVAKDLVDLGFTIIATANTGQYFHEHGIQSKTVYKVKEGNPNIVDAIQDGTIQLAINTPLGRQSRYDEYAIGRTAILKRIPFISTMSAAEAAVKGIAAMKRESFQVRSLQEYHSDI